jgi:hypothetical protein
MMSAIRLADLLRVQITEKRKEHHDQMDKGQAIERYAELVGRNKQLKEMRGWINDALTTVDSDEGETEL